MDKYDYINKITDDHKLLYSTSILQVFQKLSDLHPYIDWSKLECEASDVKGYIKSLVKTSLDHLYNKSDDSNFMMESFVVFLILDCILNDYLCCASECDKYFCNELNQRYISKLMEIFYLLIVKNFIEYNFTVFNPSMFLSRNISISDRIKIEIDNQIVKYLNTENNSNVDDDLIGYLILYLSHKNLLSMDNVEVGV